MAMRRWPLSRKSGRRRKRSADGKDHGADAGALAEEIDHLDLDSKRVLIKAFSNYFQLINIAEDQQRIRVLRQRETSGVLDESIDSAIRDLSAAGIDAKAMRELLNRMCVRLVLTAHPSEAKRKEVLVKLRSIADSIKERDRGGLLPRENKALTDAISEEIEELWQTRPTRAT